MQITQVIDEWAHVTSSLPVLQVVRCVYCYITNTKASGNNTSFSIQELKLPFNSLNSIPKWVTNISSRVPWFWLQCHPCSNPIAVLKHTQPGIPNPELQFLELQLLGSYSWEQMGKDQDYSFARVRYHITESTGSITSLIQLDLSHKRIMGKIPGTIRNLYNLQSLNLSGNQLNGGPHPEEFCVSHNLE